VLGWWDRVNELPTRIWVNERKAGWRPAKGGESFCVWDLDIIGRERSLYIERILKDGGPADIDGYLAAGAV